MRICYNMNSAWPLQLDLCDLLYYSVLNALYQHAIFCKKGTADACGAFCLGLNDLRCTF